MNRNFTLKVFLLSLIFSLQSCEHIMDQAEEKRAQENFTSEFMGSYSGTYSGDISGNLSVKVDKGAYVSVNRSAGSVTDSYSTNLIGSSFNTTSKSPQGFIMYGNLQTKTGTWEMGTAKGTWSLKKDQ